MIGNQQEARAKGKAQATSSALGQLPFVLDIEEKCCGISSSSGGG
eukprot:CAMPEP_0172756014 /NCGR_PEP_ID=MMETSP1074-20121228/160982_1 /TAXON_ID=2916 /ORGANISM="Ceratium fusus, Strain PA161109" /LENGTH=44 /DNA_ID= /DNA_START= /DNA_END= /DNA_ORIENTATION=